MSAGTETTTQRTQTARQARVRHWLISACFPFWAERGPDARGGFCERLALDGAPIIDEESRVRVQARQTYVFAQAFEMGWERSVARDLVMRGVEAVLGPCRRRDALFGKMVRPGRDLSDPQPELYDNAFCLLSLAYAARVLNDAALLDEADKTLAALDAVLAHPAGGYSETAPARLPRRQNPHMHLFEALLALEETAPGRSYGQRAEQVRALFDRAFFDMSRPALIEHFSDDWTPDRTAPMEPGHMFEWTWLLSRSARLRGAEPPAAMRQVYAAALPFLDSQGFAPMSVSPAGRVVDGTRRVWPQTEALKAHLAVGDQARTDALVDAFFAAYLTGAPAGAWRDHFDARGTLVAAGIPASTGYHIVLAFNEYLKDWSKPRLSSAQVVRHLM